MHGSFFGSDTAVIAARVEEVISDSILTIFMILYTPKLYMVGNHTRKLNL
ncbi:hypothetical protein SLEP1_g12488 [Rubroshorea leprosula]|uniref:Uncharacterized protein n=1 Tax=Rubroshorea leprosula TaxID=152421 RepID=A0AAV5IH60_9ROSI|nr:hypothetical protein SLEP1_g12488 [Rubroshorea leprosula]